MPEGYSQRVGVRNREDVAKLLAKGLTTAQIAARTGLAKSTVWGHAKAIKGTK